MTDTTPAYGAIFDDTLPAVSLRLYGLNGSSFFQSVAPGVSNTVYFDVRGRGSRRVRIAYQKRMRTTAASNWDGGETWTEWQSEAGVVGAWTELYTVNGPTVLDTIPGPNGTSLDVRRYGVHTYDISTYDMIELRAQVWVVDVSNPSAIRYGQPTSYIFKLAYSATFEVVSATIDPASRSLTVELSQDWPRGYMVARVETLHAGGVGVRVNRIQADSLVFTFAAEEVAAIIEAGTELTVGGSVSGEGTLGTVLQLETAEMQVLPISGQVPVPVIAFSDEPFAKVVSVADSSGMYARVTATAQWEGGSETFELEKAGSEWTAAFDAPFGVEVAYTVGAYIQVGAVSSFNVATASSTLNTRAFALSHGETLVWLALEAGEKQQATPNQETLMLASGRTISRHGPGASRKLTVTGELLGVRHGGTETQWVEDLNALDEPHDWIYRNAYGERFAVSVVEHSRNPQNVFDVLSVSITLSEVD